MLNGTELQGIARQAAFKAAKNELKSDTRSRLISVEPFVLLTAFAHGFAATCVEVYN